MANSSDAEKARAAQRDRMTVRKGEVRFLTPEEVQKRLKKRYPPINQTQEENGNGTVQQESE